MTSSVTGILAACHAMAQRFSDVTGGHGRADFQLSPQGGANLKYSQGCPDRPNLPYTLVTDEQLSLIRVLDSLTAHVSRALSANAEGLEIAEVRVETARGHSGLAHLSLYCPAWHRSFSIPCSYVAKNIPQGKHVTVEPVPSELLSAEEGLGWERLYDAGLVGMVSKMLPLASQAIAQLLMLNETLPLRARSVLLPGSHRRYTGFAGNGVVLADFEDSHGFWNVFPKGESLGVETASGPVRLTRAQVSELNAAMARWQSVRDAVEDCLREPR